MEDTPPLLGVIGCGRMGSALAAVFAHGGFRLRVTSRSPCSAMRVAMRTPGVAAGPLDWVAGGSDIVVLATPLRATCLDVAPRIRHLVAGKPVVDVSNPGFPPCDAPGDPRGAPLAGRSGAERIMAALPGACLVKALNCVAARGLTELVRAGERLTVPIAGDDPAAKALVRAVLERAGFDPADAGPLAASRRLEALAVLLTDLAAERGRSPVAGFRLVRRG